MELNAPPVHRLGSAVLLQGPAVADAAYLVAVGLRALSRRDGVAPMSRWLVLQRHLKAVADLVSDTGNADLPQDHDEAPLELEDLISTEAASMLGLTERQMRNLASQLGGRRAGRRAWVFDRALVELEASRRAAA